MTAERPTAVVLDSPSLFYRAFFALPRTITGPDGAAVNAVRGYLDMLSQLLVDQRPRAVVNVFDADWRPQWRVDLYAGYKAKRCDASAVGWLRVAYVGRPPNCQSWTSTSAYSPARA